MELGYVRSNSRRNSAFALSALFALNKIIPSYEPGFAPAMTKVIRRVRERTKRNRRSCSPEIQAGLEVAT